MVRLDAGPGPAIYLGAEDDENEIHIRFHDIASHYGVTFNELIDGGLHVLCKLGEDATLCAADGKSGRVETTALYRQLYEAAGDIKPKNISIDTLSRAFAGNEIDRVQVYAFAMHMQALAMVAGGSVTVLSHPSLQGIASGTGISGSTAWHGAFRFRQYLKGVEGRQTASSRTTICASSSSRRTSTARAATSSCCAISAACSCRSAAPAPLEKLATEQTADNLFLKLLDKHQKQGRNVSHHKNANSYAPTAFSKDPDAKGPGMRKALTEAMERLFTAGKIRVETYGNSGHERSKIARCQSQGEV